MRTRLKAAAVAVLTLVLGVVSMFGIFIWNDAVGRPGWFPAGGPVTAMFACGTVVAGAFGAALGIACAPGRVLENAEARRAFATGSAFGVIAIVFALAVQLFFITWPLAAVFVVLAVVKVRGALRVARAERNAG